MSELQIRPIESSDRLEWTRLWTLYLAYYKTTLPEQVYDSTFAQLISGEDHEFSGLIALQGDQAIGITHYLYHRSCWTQANGC